MSISHTQTHMHISTAIRVIHPVPAAVDGAADDGSAGEEAQGSGGEHPTGGEGGEEIEIRVGAARVKGIVAPPIYLSFSFSFCPLSALLVFSFVVLFSYFLRYIIFY